MRALQSLDPFLVELLPGFVEQHVRQQPAAHADLSMNAPDRELDAVGFERRLPGEDVLVDAVDERAVEIEHERCVHTLCHNRME